MSREDPGKHVHHDQHDVYRHDEEYFANVPNGRRAAELELVGGRRTCLGMIGQ
jgi:hypothetical protein